MICVIFIWSTVVAASGLEIPTTIKTNLGDVLGVRHTESYTKKPVYEFRKIPYAKPPVQKFRFKRPRPYGRWFGTLDATKFGPSCYQDLEMTTAFLPNTNISENCLFLNIYVPNNISLTNNYSVMVWIHGGNYDKGQGMTFNGALLACIGDVIVVTINYRLGIFGFISTGDSSAQGNYGLLDQRLAIIWVRNCIKSYGGNPHSITLFGHSAGAMSITFHSLFKKNSGLFQRIILQSGVGSSPLAISNHVESATNNISVLVNCSSDTSASMMKCMRNVSNKDLQIAYREIVNKTGAKFSPLFTPIVDRKYIPDKPSILFKNSDSDELAFYRTLDVIIGNVDNEASKYIEFLKKYKFENKYRFKISNGLSKNLFCNQIVPRITVQFYNNHNTIKEELCKKYGQSVTLNKQSLDQLSFYGDMMFYSPSKFALDAHASKHTNDSGKCFQYVFKRVTLFSMTPRMPTWVTGASHGAEVYFVFPFLELLTMSAPDGSLAQAMIKHWTHFAKTGDVNDKDNSTWPEYDISSRKYINLDTNITIGSNFRKSDMKFWLEEIPQILELRQPDNNSSTTFVKISPFILLSVLIYHLHY